MSRPDAYRDTRFMEQEIRSKKQLVGAFETVLAKYGRHRTINPTFSGFSYTAAAAAIITCDHISETLPQHGRYRDDALADCVIRHHLPCVLYLYGRNMSDEPPFNQLLERVSRGESEAADELVRKHELVVRVAV